jgi:hypothetical protein
MFGVHAHERATFTVADSYDISESNQHDSRLKICEAFVDVINTKTAKKTMKYWTVQPSRKLELGFALREFDV